MQCRVKIGVLNTWLVFVILTVLEKHFAFDLKYAFYFKKFLTFFECSDAFLGKFLNTLTKQC